MNQSKTKKIPKKVCPTEPKTTMPWLTYISYLTIEMVVLVGANVCKVEKVGVW